MQAPDDPPASALEATDPPTPGSAALTEAVPSSEATPLELTELRHRLEDYLAEAKRPATRRAYISDLKDFEDWCTVAKVDALPATAETVALYLADRAGRGLTASTLQRRLAAISVAHQMAKLETPTRSSLVRTAMQGIRRRHGTAPRQAQALRLDTLRRLLEMTRGEGPSATRDRAVLLLGFAGGFRRSELAALQVDDLEATEAGLRIVVRASKTDPEAAGAEVGIPRGRHPQTCPVTAVLRWLSVAGLTTGPLFRRVDRWDRVHPIKGLTPEAIALILKRALQRANLPIREFAGHSLRAGFATEAAAQGASERAIMRHGRWRSVTTVRRYIRSGELFTENPAAVLGL